MKTRHLLPLLLMLCMARAGNAQSTYLNPILGGD